MYDCTNKGSHSPVRGQKTILGGIGGIADALHVEHPNDPQLHSQLYCSKARE